MKKFSFGLFSFSNFIAPTAAALDSAAATTTPAPAAATAPATAPDDTTAADTAINVAGAPAIAPAATPSAPAPATTPAPADTTPALVTIDPAPAPATIDSELKQAIDLLSLDIATRNLSDSLHDYFIGYIDDSELAKDLADTPAAAALDTIADYNNGFISVSELAKALAAMATDKARYASYCATITAAANNQQERELDKDLVATADKAAAALDSANKLAISADTTAAIKNNAIYTAGKAAAAAKIDSNKAARELDNMSIFAALRLLNVAIKPYKDTIALDSSIDTAAAAPAAANMAKVAKLIGVKKFTPADCLFYCFADDTIYSEDKRESLIFRSTFTADSELAKIVSKQGKYQAIKLANNGALSVAKVAVSICSRYAKEIAAHNSKLNKAISANNKAAVAAGERELFLGTDKQYSSAIATAAYKERAKELDKVFAATPAPAATTTAPATAPAPATIIADTPAVAINQLKQGTITLAMLLAKYPAITLADIAAAMATPAAPAPAPAAADTTAADTAINVAGTPAPAPALAAAM